MPMTTTRVALLLTCWAFGGHGGRWHAPTLQSQDMSSREIQKQLRRPDAIASLHTQTGICQSSNRGALVSLKTLAMLLRAFNPATAFNHHGPGHSCSPNAAVSRSVPVASDSKDMAMRRLPRLVAFDLDGTLWYPDMYMLWGGGSPFKKMPDGNLEDRSGQPVRLCGQTQEILHSLRAPAGGDESNPWLDTLIAYVSCTDEPNWAQECMLKFDLGDDLTIKSVVDIEEIYKADKCAHFERLKKKTGIDFEDMIFFDNEFGNIRSVSRLGVQCVYTPEGMTNEVWTKAIEEFARR